MSLTLGRHFKTHSIICRRTFFSSSQPQKFTVQKSLPHSQGDLFRIISDINAYSTFVPFCVSSRVTEERDGSPSKADLTVGYKNYRESFSSLVRCTAPKQVEAIASQHPLFERLVTAWRLQPHENGKRDVCRVHLDIEYQFVNPMYGALSGAVLPKVADQIIEAFEKHANQILIKDKQ